jgi:predicted site-specific integrase-resolvase
MSTYNVSELSKLVGISVKTLQRWDREGKLVANRTPTNRRVYADEHLAKVTGLLHQKAERNTIVYARVSRPSQKPDLVNQVKTLEQFCTASGIAVDEWIQEIGGGLNFKRKQVLSLIDRIVLGNVECLVIAHKDRLALALT